MPFARFMELALYCPVYGYYEQEADNLGRDGDYFTSVSVGPLFGELLAFQFAEWLNEFAGHATAPVCLMEAGAHDGRLAADILGWLRRHRPQLFARLDYRILEPSPRRQEWQRRMLAEFAGKVAWAADFAALRASDVSDPVPAMAGSLEQPPVTLIFCNELLDALPVRRIGWDAGARVWFEWGVGLEGERFVWTRRPADQAAPGELAALLQQSGVPLPDELLAALPDGFTTEICPAALDWWQDAARFLQRGKLMTLDYGLSAAEFLSPQRKDGTLRAYRGHHVSGDVLADPGRQDLTAHVNFTALQTAGEAVGLRTESFTSQAEFLVRIMKQAWHEPEAFGGWDANRLRQFKTLSHPEHLGRAFRVLVQARTS